MRVAFGAIIWLLILFGGFVVGRNYYASSSEATGQLAQFLTQSRTDIELQFANDVLLCVGDPIIHYDDNGIPSVVGTIEQLDAKDSVERGLSFSIHGVRPVVLDRSIHSSASRTGIPPDT